MLSSIFQMKENLGVSKSQSKAFIRNKKMCIPWFTGQCSSLLWCQDVHTKTCNATGSKVYLGRGTFTSSHLCTKKWGLIREQTEAKEASWRWTEAFTSPTVFSWTQVCTQWSVDKTGQLRTVALLAIHPQCCCLLHRWKITSFAKSHPLSPLAQEELVIFFPFVVSRHSTAAL